jgi:SAM-dependent methyltransferase
MVIICLIIANMAKIYSSNPDKQVEFLKEVLAIDPNSTGLDIGCGAGYHTFKLQEITNNIYGLDLNLTQYELKNYIQGNIFESDLEFNSELDFAFALAPYFDTDWNKIEILFTKLHKYLKPGGKFLLDLFNFNSISIGKTLKDFEVFPQRILLTTYTKEEKAYTGKRIIKFSDWSEKYMDLYWRVFNREELNKIAESDGFKITKEFGSFDSFSPLFEKPSWEANFESKGRLIVLFEKI